jgi:hypothetical protein
MRPTLTFLVVLALFIGCSEEKNPIIAEPEIPQAPSNLIGETLGPSSVRLSWIDNSNNEAGFVIYRSDTTLWAEAGRVGADETAFIDTGLADSTEYRYAVAAYSEDGSSATTDVCRTSTASIELFGVADNISTGFSVVGLLAADLDNDSDLDLATCTITDNSIRVFLNEGDLNFVATTEYYSAYHPGRLVSGDFDGDSRNDLISLSLDQPIITLWINDGAGRFTQSWIDTLSGHRSAFCLGDFDRDGDSDLAVGVADDSTRVVILSNAGNGMFDSTAAYILAHDRSVYAVASRDLNNDAFDDIVVLVGDYSFRGVMVFLNNGAGAFLSSATYDLYQYRGDLLLYDIDADGDEDILTGDDNLNILRNNGAGIFNLESIYFPGSAIGAGDFDLDGSNDILLSNYNALSMLSTDRTGRFSMAYNRLLPASIVSAVCFDIDGDLDIDIAGAATSARIVIIENLIR